MCKGFYKDLEITQVATRRLRCCRETCKRFRQEPCPRSGLVVAPDKQVTTYLRTLHTLIREEVPNSAAKRCSSSQFPGNAQVNTEPDCMCPTTEHPTCLHPLLAPTFLDPVHTIVPHTSLRSIIRPLLLV